MLRTICQVILTLFIYSACQSTDAKRYQELRDGLNSRFAMAFLDNQSYPILYASNRAALSPVGSCSNGDFGVEKGSELHFGLCRVQVPANRPVGSLSSGSDPNSDSHINFKALQHEALDANSFADLLKQSSADEILIFVHGFNVRFEEAVFRAAQLGFDGKYQGQLVLFSWPAGAPQRWIEGPYLLRTYQQNMKNAEASVAEFERLLLMAASAKKRIHIVVHSMGHQVVLPALAHAAEQLPPKSIQELILNAPDFPVETFKRLFPSIQKLAIRTTVYCSPNDNALAASTRVNGTIRLGQCTLIDGVDTIDVSEVDKPMLGLGGLGHGYYAGRPIIGDVTQLLLGMDASRRMFIKRSLPEIRSNFILRP